MKMRNFVKEKIAANGYALGAFVAGSILAGPVRGEILGLNGLDFVMIDCEHAETNPESIVQMCRASESYGMAPLVRVYDPDDGPMMSRMLDVGVQGVMAPLVNTPEQARYIVNYTKFPPVGHRGANGGRGPRWGAYDNYTVQANEQCLTIMQCESLEGLKNIEEICQTPGLDVIFIGTGDLSLEMGVEWTANAAADHKTSDVRLAEAVDHILEVCRRNGVIAGIVTASAEDAARRIRQGFQFVTCMNDLGFFRSRSAKHIQTVRDLVKGE